MTQAEKDLLLIDLCTRFPYNVKVIYENKVFNIDYISAKYEEIKLDIPDNYTLNIAEVKPYLFPLSSMTDEQEKEYDDLNGYELGVFPQTEDALDYLIANHFDYRGLIPKGLANDATGLGVY